MGEITRIEKNSINTISNNGIRTRQYFCMVPVNKGKITLIVLIKEVNEVGRISVGVFKTIQYIRNPP